MSKFFKTAVSIELVDRAGVAAVRKSKAVKTLVKKKKYLDQA